MHLHPQEKNAGSVPVDMPVDESLSFVLADVQHWVPSKLLLTLSENDVPFNKWMKYVNLSTSKL